jgi:hypothetical protein
MLLVDEFSSFKWIFLRRKAESIRKVIKFVRKLQARIPEMVKFQVQDGIQNNPQEIGKVERLFATLRQRTRTVLNNAGSDEEHHQGLWRECARCATMLSNVLSKNSSNPLKMFHSKIVNFGKGNLCEKEHEELSREVEETWRSSNLRGLP